MTKESAGSCQGRKRRLREGGRPQGKGRRDAQRNAFEADGSNLLLGGTLAAEQNAGSRTITRRSFLKTTAAVAAGTTATVSLTSCAQSQPGLPQVAGEFVAGQPNNEGETIFRGVCRPNCFGFCHLNVHVRDGKVVKTSRAPYNEDCYAASASAAFRTCIASTTPSVFSIPCVACREPSAVRVSGSASAGMRL